MKRIAALLALALIGLPCLSAAGTGDFVLSPRVGFNLATFTGEDVTPDVNYREGMCFGWCLEYPFNPRMVARAELLYTQKGADVDFAEGFVIEQMQFKVDYLELPVLLRLNLITGKPTTPFILLGPAFAVKTCAEGKLAVATEAEDQPFFLNDYEDFDMGLTGGAGVTFPIFNRLGFAEVRYNYGLTKFDNSKCADLEDESVCEKDDKRNSVISVVLGLQTK